ncbi:MAG: transposase [Burkholderiales bacterium]|nr:transposase [Opitutaceae bacterium]
MAHRFPPTPGVEPFADRFPPSDPHRSPTVATPSRTTPSHRALHPPPLRRLDHVWIKNPVYFLTACTASRTPLLASPAAHDVLRAEWFSAATRHGWQIGRYVVMPDHVHFFACALPTAKPLPAFLQAWKQWTSKGILAALGHPAPLWQARTFDHVLRQRDSYAEKWAYVEQNPVRAGLALTAASWPYAGRIHFDLPL